MRIPYALVTATLVSVLAAQRFAMGAPDAATAAWNIQPDTAQGTTATQPGGGASPLNAALDPFQTKTSLSLSSGLKWESSVTLPAAPSKYALITDIYQNYEIWNLKTGTKEKTSVKPLMFDDVALSQDGQYIAGRSRPGSEISLYSTYTNKIITSIPNPVSATDAGMRILGFAGNSRLVLCKSPTDYLAPLRGRAAANAREMKPSTLHFFDTASGAGAGEMTVPGSAGAHATSAGGKYLAMFTDWSGTGAALTMIDVDACKALGTVTLQKDYQDGRITASSAGFSPDGQELAVAQAISAFPRGMQLHILSAATGKTLAEKYIEISDLAMGTGFQGPLQWSPDGKRMIVGKDVVDRKDLTLQPIGGQGGKFSAPAVRWADATTIVAFQSPAGKLQTMTYALKSDGVTVATGNSVPPVARGRGVPDAAALRESADAVTAVSQSGTMKISLDFPASGAWRVPAIVGEQGTGMADSWKLPDIDTLSGDGMRIPKVLYSGEAAHVMLVESARDEGGVLTHVQMLRYDLGSGAAGAKLPLEDRSTATDVSPSGDTLVVRPEKQDMLKIYRFKNGSYALDSTHGTLTIPGGSPRPDDSRLSALLVDDDHVLVNGRGRVGLVDLRALRMVWQADTGSQVESALSPDRKVAAICTRNGVTLVDVMTGRALGGMVAADDSESIWGAAISQDGTRLAVARESNKFLLIDVYDVKSGKRIAEGPIGEQPGTDFWIRFLSPDFVLDSQGVLFSVKRGAAIWQYFGSMPPFGSSLPAKGFVYPYWKTREELMRAEPGKIPDFPLKTPATMVSTVLPHPSALAMLDKPEDALFVWHPHMTVSLHLQAKGDEAYQKEQVGVWTKKLEEIGFKVDDKSPNELWARTDFLPASALFVTQDGKEFVVDEDYVGHEISLTVAGNGVWHDTVNQVPFTGKEPPALKVTVRAGETPAQAAARQYPPVTRASAIVLPPTYIAREGAMGMSQLKEHGPVDTKAPGLTPVP